jgi:putative FmdB family regulatory protein
MPIYTYRCENCGIQFDRRQKFDDEPLTFCSECQKESLRKVYLPVGIVFKGSGFYATDNRSPSGRESRASDDQGETESESSGVEKTEKKKSTKTDKTKTEQEEK